MSTKLRTTKRRAAPAPTDRRKKTLLLDQKLLDRARRALGAATETDTVAQALELVVRRQKQIDGIMQLGKLGPIDPALID